jgi:hypothetical protein
LCGDEEVGVDGIVSLVQTCLTDHREIFDALDQRQRLADVLHMFAEHGWHAGVELLFGLSRRRYVDRFAS